MWWMRLIENHGMTEEICAKLLGWKWLSYIGAPTRNIACYPRKCRVRQFFSPKQLKSKRWNDYLKQNEVQDATGDEPLAFCYCSEGGSILPRIILLIDDE
jgi:hypothetical protein